MGILLDTLRSVDFLAGLPDAEVTQFMVLGKSVDAPKGHVFWRAGAPPQIVVVPVTGEVKTSTRNDEGREFIDRFVAAGECIGLPGALDGMPQPTDAEIVRAGEFFVLPRAELVRFLDARPARRAAAARMVGMMYRNAIKEREDVALRPVPQRVAEFLLNHACVRQDDGAKVLVHATQAELAARLGTVREVVARTLADFDGRGLIERMPQGVFIADWDGLRAEAGVDAAAGAAAGADPGVRTARFFLPTVERRRGHEDAADAAGCREHLGDLSLCRERGCPNADRR